jgi:hypothetical protein
MVILTMRCSLHLNLVFRERFLSLPLVTFMKFVLLYVFFLYTALNNELYTSHIYMKRTLIELCLQALLTDIRDQSQVSRHASAVLRIQDVYPGSRIPDPKTVTKEWVEKICLSCLFCNHKYHKTGNCFIFELGKKLFGPMNFQRIIVL